MSPLFGKSPQKAAQDEAAKAEADRLAALPPRELAAEVMPAFGPGGSPRADRGLGSLHVAMFLMRDHPRGNLQVKQLLEPIRESIQVLEHAELVRTEVLGTGGALTKATRLGRTALAEGSVPSYLEGDPA